MADGDGKGQENGVVGGSPGDLFENFSEEEAGLVADATPFRTKAMPIGGSRKGRPNKRTVEMRDLYLKSGFPHPLLWQGSMLRMGVDGLAGMLGCDLVDAADLLRKIAADALPYIEGKQPNKVIVEGTAGLPVLVLGDALAAIQAVRDARDDGALAIDDDLEGAIEKQRLKDEARVRLQGCVSHDDDKSLNKNEKSTESI